MNSTDGDFGEIQHMVDLRYQGYDDPRHQKEKRICQGRGLTIGLLTLRPITNLIRLQKSVNKTLRRNYEGTGPLGVQESHKELMWLCQGKYLSSYIYFSNGLNQ